MIVLWGYFDAGIQETDGVYYIDGEKLAEWLRTRPVDLHHRRWAVVEAWLVNWTAPDEGAPKSTSARRGR